MDRSLGNIVVEKQISKTELVSEQNKANESILASGNRLVQP